MSLYDWIDRYPGVKRLLEQPDDVLEGVSVESNALLRHVYTLDYCAGETIRVGERVSLDDECAVRWAPGKTLLGVALTQAAPGDTVRVQISEVYFAH
jgi:predicted RecA/RadA family phage recombinase